MPVFAFKFFHNFVKCVYFASVSVIYLKIGVKSTFCICIYFVFKLLDFLWRVADSDMVYLQPWGHGALIFCQVPELSCTKIKDR